MQIKYPNSRHASLGDVMPDVDDMRIIVLLNDAYLNNKKVRSIRELKSITGVDNLARLKSSFALIEGEKVLPDDFVEKLLSGAKTLNIEREYLGDVEHFAKCSQYLSGDLLEPFDEPIGTFTILPEQATWLIHTRDNEPWIYCLLPDSLGSSLLDNNPDMTEEITRDFPYN